MSSQSLLLISRDDIIRDAQAEDSRKLLRLLAWLTRHGFHLLATASMPDPSNSKDRWLKEGGDASLFGQDSIRSRIDEAGGTLDGVYYVPRSFISQNRNRINSLRDMMQRYATSPESTYLYSSSKKWAQAAGRLEIHATWLQEPGQLIKELKRLKQSAGSH